MQSELFEWDDAKARRNFQIHGVDFEEAKTIFEDPFAITIRDELHSDDEDRSVTLGLSLLSRMLLVVHTERRERIRIISVRKATPGEKCQYEIERKAATNGE